MKNEKIKTYTEITVEQAFKLAAKGEDLCFTQDEGDGRKFWTEPTELESIHLNRTEPFKPYYCSSFKYCATVTEIDPCQAPDGCPELEPWMAYVGLGKYIPVSVNGEYYVKNSTGVWDFGYCAEYSGGNARSHYAIDVRTAWAQEHFSEHVRIRNYQEPCPIQEAWDEQLCSYHTLDEFASFKRGWTAAMAYLNINPQPTK